MSEKDESFQAFKNEEIRRENTRMGIARIIKACPAALDSGSNWAAATDAVIQELRKDYELTPNDSGSWVKGFDRSGKEIDLNKLASDAFLRSPHVDKASIHKAVESGALKVESKDDLRDVPAKVAFIRTFGEKAFTDLPLHRPEKFDRNPDVMTAKQYLSLSRSERAHLGLTPEQTSKVLGRK